MGHRKRAGGHSRLTILRQVEHSEVPAYDFPCLIALDSLSAGIPVGDDAVGIEHVNGVINDTFDQQAKSALTFKQAALRNTVSNHATSCLTPINPRTRFRFRRAGARQRHGYRRDPRAVSPGNPKTQPENNEKFPKSPGQIACAIRALPCGRARPEPSWPAAGGRDAWLINLLKLLLFFR